MLEHIIREPLARETGQPRVIELKQLDLFLFDLTWALALVFILIDMKAFWTSLDFHSNGHFPFTTAFIVVINLPILQLCAEDDLYCKPCNQYFNNLHNKREHILGRKHKQTVSGKLSESDAEEEELPGFNAPVFTEEFLKHNESKIFFTHLHQQVWRCQSIAFYYTRC